MVHEYAYFLLIYLETSLLMLFGIDALGSEVLERKPSDYPSW